MSQALTYNNLLGHLVRSDPWLEQGQSSYELAFAALDSADFSRARDYGAITVQEASEAYELYALWLDQIPQVLLDNGIDQNLLSRSMSQLVSTIGDHDLDTGWSTYQSLIEAFADACHNGDGSLARSLLDEARGTWQHHHDRACDTICGLLDVAAAAMGEAFIGELWDILLAGMYERSARVYHPANLSWAQAVERLVLDIFEATRGHLTGPRRDGAFSVVEEESRWVITFAPCGSGGRSYAPEPVGPAAAHPADAAGARSVTTERHDWAWNRTGVCLYCAHCCQLQQRAPIARLGFPLRVIDPPIQGQDPVCTWSIYKDPARVPDKAYTSVGFEAPARREPNTHTGRADSCAVRPADVVHHPQRREGSHGVIPAARHSGSSCGAPRARP